MSITINFAAITAFISSPLGHFILAILAVPVMFIISGIWFKFIKLMFRIFFSYKVKDFIDNFPIILVTSITMTMLVFYFLKLFVW